MFSHLMAFIAGIIVATVGLVPLAQMGDQGVSKIQQTVREVTK